jgi:hypothetical protein
LTWSGSFACKADKFWIGESHKPPEVVGTADLLDTENGGRLRNVGLRQALYA